MVAMCSLISSTDMCCCLLLLLHGYSNSTLHICSICIPFILLDFTPLHFFTSPFFSSRAASALRCWLVRSRWDVLLILFHPLGAAMVCSSTPAPSLMVGGQGHHLLALLLCH